MMQRCKDLGLTYVLRPYSTIWHHDRSTSYIIPGSIVATRMIGKAAAAAAAAAAAI